MDKIKTAGNINRSIILTDPAGSFLWRMLQLISHFTWELPQQLLGILLAWLFLFFGGISKTMFRCRGVLFLESPYYEKGAGLTLGNIITTGPGTGNSMKQHEFGHYIQSRVLGPLYLPLIALPSLLWAIFITTAWKHGYLTSVDYEWFFIEKKCLPPG